MRDKILRICYIGLMAALAFITNYFRIPLFDSKIHIGNAVCILSGFFLGPTAGFLASGIGNLLFDLLTGYGAESLITFVSKGAIALVAGLIAGMLFKKKQLTKEDQPRLIIASVAGALIYVVLYMLKTFIYGLTINGLTMEATGIKMLAKLPASLINAAFAAVVSPLLANVMFSPLRHIGVFDATYKK